MPEHALLELSQITKRFPGVTANDGINLELNRGEVLALLGENGAGKSTLISILYGLYRPDEGEIRLEGKAVEINSPAHALKMGIGLVPQHPVLVNRHTVAENLALGVGAAFMPAQRLAPRIKELAAQYGLEVNPNARVGLLSPGEKQRVEILRALLGGASVLILDEPTSVLTPQEAEALFRVMRELRGDGKSLIFISHKLEEVLSISDRITVLRRGKVVGNLSSTGATKPGLAELMVGRSVSFDRKRITPPLSEPLLEVTNLSAKSARGLEALRDVSFTLRRGEVLGVAGVAGNGQSELIEVLAGLHAHSGGRVMLDGAELKGNPAELFARGVAHIPEDRIHMGTVPSMTVAENLGLRSYGHAPFANGFWREAAAYDTNATAKIAEYVVSTPGIHTPSRLLSGGNIQKVILARELSGDPKLILAVHPTYGLDIGATDQVHKTLLERTGRGAGVLLVSEDLEELMSLSDRIAVMYHGELRGPYDVANISREQIGLLMTGANLELSPHVPILEPRVNA
jgi:general nucleoside transport system ATP-binding protein